MRLWLIATTLRSWARNSWEAAFGSRPRQIATVVVLAVLALVVSSIQPEQDEASAVEDLRQALDVSQFFEKENRQLHQQLDEESRRRKVAEQTISALSENIGEQDEIILNMQQQLAFYRQLLEERGRPESDIVIRSFEIVPDFRENHYQLHAVIVRGGADIEPFEGRLGLALSLRDGKGVEFENHPPFEPGALDVEFRYYHEAKAVFPIPAGSDILNGQLALYSKDGEPITSLILVDQP